MDFQTKIENTIPKDKALHAIGGYIAYCIARIITFFLNRNTSILVSCAVVVLVAVGKEVIIDKWIRKKQIDWMDVVATIMGSIPACINDLVN